MASQQAKNKEDKRLTEFENEPGMTKVKKPKMTSLVQDGVLDLKRFMDPDVAAQYMRPGGSKPGDNPDAPAEPALNNREREAKGQPTIPALMWHPSKPLDLTEYVGQVVQVTLRTHDILRAARNAKKKSLWGSGTYTADSDLCSALVHQGLLPQKCIEFNYTWPGNIPSVNVLLRVKPPQAEYSGEWYSGSRSRTWPNPCFAFSFAIERCWLCVMVPRPAEAILDGEEEKEDSVEVCLDFPAANATGKGAESVRPFLMPSCSDARVTTRQISTGPERRRQKTHEFATVAYNCCNEPWLKYTPSGMADRGYNGNQYILSKFEKHVLYLEADGTRYELRLAPEQPTGDGPPVPPIFTLSKCKRKLMAELTARAGTPLPSHMVDVIFTGLTWESLEWGASTLYVTKSAAKEGDKDQHMDVALSLIHWQLLAAPQPAAGGVAPAS